MNAIHRLAISIRAQFEDFVDQVENHEAVAEASLKQFRDNVVNAKFKLRCLEKEIQRTDGRVQALKTEAADWKGRALRVETQDHTKALECVKRMCQAEMEAQHLIQQGEEMQKIHRDVQRDVQQIESQYEDLRRRHKILISRQSRAEILKNVSGAVNPDVPQAFERWEARVEKSELFSELGASLDSAGFGAGLDSLSEEFRTAEETEALETVLAELRSKS